MPSCTINRSIGNCYSASVFSSILSLICEKGNALVDKRVLAFSYGSGSMASVYSFVGRVPLTEVGDGMSPFSLDRIQNTVNVKDRLERRRACDVNEFNSSLNTRERQYGKVLHIVIVCHVCYSFVLSICVFESYQDLPSIPL